MSKIIGIPIPSVLLLSTLLFAQGQWKSVQYTQWSQDQVNAVLNNSPWTALMFAGRQLSENALRQFGAERVLLRIRLLTAKPVRQALLRQLSLHKKTVHIQDLLGGAYEDPALSAFIQSRPNDVRVAGDSRHIILSVTILAIGEQGWEEYDDDESLADGNIPELTDGASLATNAGKRVDLVRYEPAGPDRLGAKLYFPRNLPDGMPLVEPGNKELRFETRINDRRIVVEFDLRQMKYQGKLEL